MVNKKVGKGLLNQKKAQDMSVTTIILVVLGLIVLVILVLGFTVGWGKMKDWILPSNNVATISDQCKIACATDKTYDYCFSPRTLKIDGVTTEGVSCYSLSKTIKYGIDACSPISCNILDDSIIADCTKPENKGKELYYLDGIQVMTKAC